MKPFKPNEIKRGLMLDTSMGSDPPLFKKTSQLVKSLKQTDFVATEPLSHRVSLRRAIHP